MLIATANNSAVMKTNIFQMSNLMTLSEVDPIQLYRFGIRRNISIQNGAKRALENL